MLEGEIAEVDRYLDRHPDWAVGLHGLMTKARARILDNINTELDADELDMARQNKGFQPMLAKEAPDLSEIKLPVWGSRKLNGIRCVIRDGVPLSRKLKPIPNLHISKTLQALELPQLDGELLLEDNKGPFSKVSSAVMSKAGWPKFEYHVFDIDLQDLRYWQRYRLIKEIIELSQRDQPLRLVPHWKINTLEDLRDDEAAVVAEGWEGLMLRGIDSPYKYGRSTVREGYLLKVKRFIDDEATITGMTELMRNENDLESDEVGYAKRSSAKGGKVPADVMGTLQLRWNSPGSAAHAIPAGPVDFELGTGFDAKTREEFWYRDTEMIGQLVKFKYQEIGAHGRPIFASYQGLRHKDDV